MLCKQCGYYAADEAVVCPQCGAILKDGAEAGKAGAESIRQGKRAREAVKNRPQEKQEEIRRRRRAGASKATIAMPAVKDTRVSKGVIETDDEEGDWVEMSPDAEDEPEGIERRYHGVYSDESTRQAQAAAYAARHAPGHGGKMVNWFKVGLLLAAAVILVVVGGIVFLEETEAGQRLLARLGQNASSTALWAVGEELLDSGDIEGAIADFEKAKAQDAENEVVDVDGLLLLGSAYEAAGRTEDAAALYEEIYTETPSRSEAY